MSLLLDIRQQKAREREIIMLIATSNSPSNIIRMLTGDDYHSFVRWVPSSKYILDSIELHTQTKYKVK